MLFINFLIQKDFLNTRSSQSSFPLTNENSHLISHEPMKFRVTKSQIKVEIWGNRRPASEGRVDESDISFESF